MAISVIGFFICCLWVRKSINFKLIFSLLIYFFITISFLLFLSFFVSGFSVDGFSVDGFSVVVSSSVHDGFSVVDVSSLSWLWLAFGSSKSVYSISHWPFSFLNFDLMRYPAFSNSLIPHDVPSLPSLASLVILSTAKSQSSGLLCKYQYKPLAFQEIFGSLSNMFGVTQNLFAIFNFGMVL